VNIVKRLIWRALDSFPLGPVVRAIDLASHNRFGRRGMLDQAFEFVTYNKIDGDYFEFGVWRGNSFCFAHRLKKKLGLNMKMWAFDSFEGLPPTDEEKYNTFKQGEYACSEPDFRNILRQHGIRNDEYQIVKGYYQDSLNQDQHQRMRGSHASIVYVDCDLYVSTKPVLDFLPPYLMDGTVICFDDYYCFRGSPEEGQQRAIREFLAENPCIHFTPYLDFAPVGKSFLVHISEHAQHAT